MKKGLTIALLVVCALILVVLTAILIEGGVFVIEGLNGKDGIDGSDGKNGLDGSNGLDGADGKSAYELALEDGFEGSLHEWLLSLAVRGADGEDGKTGKEGVGVKSVRVNEDGDLLVTLTDGRVLNAGFVGNDGSGVTSTEPDADGYYEVYETVIMEGASSLNLRLTPDTVNGVILTSVSKGTELLRVGDQKTDEGFSRLVYNGQICYARSKYFEVKYEYKGEIPEIHLPDSIVLTEGVEAWFITDQILPDISDDLKITYSYSGEGARVYDGCEAFSITPAWKNASSATPHAPETATLSVKVQKRVDGELRTIHERSVSVTVVDAQTDLSLTGIVIGDSRISDGTLVSALKNDLSNLTLLGTRSFHDIPHEGRGAWSTAHYLERESLTIAGSVVPNAFYNPATGGFDFTYYMNQNYSAAALDFVVINLGANDNFSKASVGNIEKMVQSIQGYAAAKGKSVKIFVMTEYLSPADGYYLEQSSNTDVDAKRDKQFKYFTYLDAAFSGREDEGVYLLPNYLAIDSWTDRLRKTVTTSSGEEQRIFDVVHLGRNGYLKEAAMIEAYLYRIFGVQ
ncbi:MAG: hypothetical protein IJZ80_00930 [Clostridia bacterium]|nr:hypothetical protein [Clostridia bacterium]